MDGMFRKGLNRLYGVLCLASGIGLMGLISFVLITDPAVQPDDIGYLAFFIFFGLICAIAGGISLYLTGRVFLRAEEDRIRGFSGMSGRLECAMSDVDHVFWGGTGLTIELKNGRRYNFNDLRNSHEIGAFIRNRTFVAPKVDMDREELARTIVGLNRREKWQAFGMLAACVGMLLEILTAVALTGGREPEQFTAQDWTVLGIGAAAVLATFAVFFLLLRRMVKTQRELGQLLFALPDGK